MVHQLESTQWLAPDVIRARQGKQLGQLARWLDAHSPAFARRLKAARLKPADLATTAGLAALPPIDRRWFQSEKGVNCDRVPSQHDPVGVSNTSGSTGEYLRVAKSKINQFVWLAMAMRDHVWRNTDFSVPLATVRATTSKIERFPNWGPPVSMLYNSGPALTLPISLRGERFIEELTKFRAGNLIIYPNALKVLLNAMDETGKALPDLKAIRTIGEMASAELRARTKDTFGFEFTDAYTCQETGYIALQCPDAGTYHVMAEAQLVEVLRDDGTPCEEGEIGTVALTDLHNHATPIVRYLVGDMAEVGGQCPCGRGLPTLRRIVGRSRNLVRLPDGSRVWPTMGGLGETGFLKVVPIIQYQYAQIESDLIEIRLVVERPLREDEEQVITERLHGAVGHPFRVTFKYFQDRIPLPASGKFEDFICLV